MKLFNVLKSISGRLQRSPFLWKLAVSLYGFRGFNPSRTRYKRSPLSSTQRESSGKTYDLVFDAQCLQTPTFQRGIGTYSLNFISAVCQERPKDSFAAVLTTIASPADLAVAKSALENLHRSNLDILIFDPFESKKKIKFVEAQQKLLRDLDSTHCRAVVSLSSFEKKNTVITLPKSSKYKLVAILYDLIPLQFPKGLLISRKQKTAYFWSLNNIAKYDLLLSISQESKRQWINLVSSTTKVEVIYGGCDAKEINQYKNFNERHGILCVGAEQPHKNIERLIIAYCQLPEQVQLEHNLTIVGIRSIGVRKKFLNLSRKAIGKVNIPEYLDQTKLATIYDNARLLVMPSLVEGLSLPILEAWSHGLVAVGSSKTVAQELIGVDSLLFDPYNPLSISECMNQFLTSEAAWNRCLENSISRSSLFTWESTANLALDAIEAVDCD